VVPADRRPALFLSSTGLDLGPYREVVIHVCQRLGIDLVAMEEFGPDPRAAAELCRQKVESADLFLGLYAHRYGFVPEGFDGASITQLEYEWAVARHPAPPVLLFLIDEELPWLPKWIDHGVPWDRLQALKARLRKAHVVGNLTTPEKLREDLFAHLPKFRDEVRGPVAAPASTPIGLPLPPEPYAAHQYTLLQTAQVIGRDKELAALDGWVADPASPFAAARILSLVAIGGMGKSALTWKWFHARAPEAMTPLAGRLWWSFYEADAGFDRFVRTTLAYCTGQAPESLQSISPLDRERELLAILDREPFLLVLDGLERVLIAYANLDFAHLSDEDLDQRTDNAVAGALGLPQEAGNSFIARHRLRKTIDPRVGDFLRKLAQVRAARVLVTTRLYPSELQTVTGHELPGTAAWFLRGLDRTDALTLWRAMKVSGTDAELAKLFATIEHYPLLIRALAGEVAGYRPAPGDFDRWRQAHPDFNPFVLPLVQAKSHVLAHALGNLGDNARDMLHTIAAFRAALGYDTLRALFVSHRGWTPQGLDAVLGELEDRGLVGWDRTTNHYDLHPIVRSVIWSSLNDIDRRHVYGALERHFSAIPARHEGVDTVAEALPLIEFFSALVGLGRHEDAGDVYFDRLYPGRFSFAAAGMEHIHIGLLESLFPDGLDQRPAVRLHQISGVIAQLGYAYGTSGRLVEAHSWALRHLRVSGKKDLAHANISRNALRLGYLRQALDHARYALATGAVLSDYSIGRLAICEATVGQIGNALRRLDGQQLSERYDPGWYMARIHLWEGNFAKAAEFAKNVLERQQERAGMGVALFQAEVQMNLGHIDEAIALLTDVLREARATVLVEPELESLRCLAEAHRRNRQYARSRAYLEDLEEPAARGPYRLIQADAANVLAKMEIDCGNRDAAVAAAEHAYRLAWCDGPDYSYYWALREAASLLRRLDAPSPRV
jgi:tetratricopeptide (TPR) repeat protein